MVCQKKRALRYPAKCAIVASGTGTAAQRGVFTYDASGVVAYITASSGAAVGTAISTSTSTGM